MEFAFCRQAAQKWESTKKSEWSTPKRPRLEDFSAIEGILSPVPSIDDGEDAMDDEDEERVQQTQSQSSSFDRPETPPLSQKKARSMAESPEKVEGASRGVGPRRNLMFRLEDEGSL